ncbi:hypothetical protein FJR45_07210 [Sulfurimonas sediminis]|uniref:Uncharacterized protein n=1 Tax=Sulfurimonas sediminis TaxID=2590020 RepID=A0A7M1B4V2_9BACT|nr:hypothetical protein [Sulfurimonas sediminis]QOP43748.1 hypothetical protein FJR45_07210 [Sulfurimonas sediminis]
MRDYREYFWMGIRQTPSISKFPQTIREQFIEYIDSGISSKFKFVTIEAIYDDLKNFSALKKGVKAKRTALVELELNAIKQAYSLIIFPESVGSYTELGYFTAIDETKEKIYVVNDYNYSGAKSYLNHIIDVIHNDREMRALQIDFKSTDNNHKFAELIHNLEEDYTSHQHTLKFMESEFFPLVVTYEIIRLMPILSYRQIEDMTRELLDNLEYSKYEKKNFTVLISLLVVAKVIERFKEEEQIYFRPIDSDYTLVDTNLTERQKATLIKLQLEYGQEDSRSYI